MINISNKQVVLDVDLQLNLILFHGMLPVTSLRRKSYAKMETCEALKAIKYG
jgi:hypothetical protein